MRYSTKVYVENNTRYQFYPERLMLLVNQKKYRLQQRGKKVTKTSIMEELAEKACVSTEAIKNWMYGYNGPSDLEQVKSLGEYFQVDYHFMLDEEEIEMPVLEKTSDHAVDTAQRLITKNRIREIYKGMLEFLDLCRYYHSDLATDLVWCGEILPEEVCENYYECLEDANQKMRMKYFEVRDEIDRSMLDIPEDDFVKLKEFLWARLFNCIDLVADPDRKPPKKGEPEPEGYPDQNDFVEFWELAFDNYIEELRELFADYTI